MSNTGWGGDLNAAKEFHAKVHGPLGDSRRGRDGARGARGGSNMTRRGNSFANTNSFTNDGNRSRSGLLTELPSHFWNPVNMQNTQNTQAAKVKGRGDPMNVEDHCLGGLQGASDTRPAAAHAPVGQVGVGSAPTPTSWGTNTQPIQPSTPALWSSTDSCHPTEPARDRASSPPRGLDKYTHGAVNKNTNGPRDHMAADSQSTTREHITWGPRNTPVSRIIPFDSLACAPVTDQQVKQAQNGKTAPQGVEVGAQDVTSAADAGRPWPGLKASRHAAAAGLGDSTGHTQSGSLRRDLLQENGMLRGVQFTEDQGPQQDNDWLKTYNLNKVKDKCVVVATQAFANGDHEAGKALHKVAAACSEVLRAKNVLKDKKLEGEADKVLSKSQNEAWVHWIKFYHPTAPAADPAANQTSNKSPNVHMQDAPTIVTSQTVQVTAPSTTTGTQVPAKAQVLAAPQHTNFDGVDSGGFGPTGLQQQSTHTSHGDNCDRNTSNDFDSSSPQQFKPVAQQALNHPQQPSRTAQFDGNILFGGFNASKAQQSTATVKQTQTAQRRPVPQQTTELTGMPSKFPQGLPSGFDDPQARKIFEDFFFQNKRLPRK